MLELIAAVLSPALLGGIGTAAVVVWLLMYWQHKLVTFSRYEVLLLIPPVLFSVGFELTLGTLGVDLAVSIALSRLNRLLLYGTYLYLGIVILRRARCQ